MSDSSKQDRIEELLRKSLLGEELVNTQFHLYSARSSSPSRRRRVLKPRALYANNVLLAKSSKFFLDLLSSDVHPSDPSLIDLTHEDDVPRDAAVDAYGYRSDSDLDDCPDDDDDDEPVPVTRSKAPKKQRRASRGDGSESDSSDMFVMSPEEPLPPPLPKGANRSFSFAHNRDGAARSEASSETAVQDAKGRKTMARSQTAMRLRSLGSRHVLVKDTAFQTWYTLLNYLYTDKFSFLPLSSTTPGGQPRESLTTSPLDEPKCSAKSMYRLAAKVGLDDLRDEAFSYIRSSLSEHNILRELSCSLVSTHPALLEMELDVLYAHIGSAPVVADFSALARRIANKELPQGADIVVGMHTRLLKDPRALPLRPSWGQPSIWGSKSAESGSEDDGVGVEDENETEVRPASPVICPPPTTYGFGPNAAAPQPFGSTGPAPRATVSQPFGSTVPTFKAAAPQLFGSAGLAPKAAPRTNPKKK